MPDRDGSQPPFGEQEFVMQPGIGDLDADDGKIDRAGTQTGQPAPISS